MTSQISRPARPQNMGAVTTTGRSAAWPTLVVLLVAPFLSQADATIANVAAPSVGVDLDASGAALELVVSGYLVAFAVLLITGARLGHSYGYKRMFLTGLTIFGLASLACGFASGQVMLILARVVQGGAAALMFPQTLTGIQLNFEGARRARAIGLFAIALSSGAVLGQIFGGLLVNANIDGLGWRVIFLINAPIVLAAVTAARRILPADPGRKAHRVDVPGIATLSAGVLLLVLPLSLGRAMGWPTWTWVALGASVPALAGFIAVERRVCAHVDPLINLRVVAPRQVSAGLVNLGLSAATYLGLLFTLAQYLQGELGYSPLISGLTVVPWVGAFGLAAQLVPRLPASIAARLPVAGSLVLTAAYAAISVASFAGHADGALLLTLLALGGLGLGMQFSSMLTYVSNAVATDHAADISGVATTIEQIGGSLGVAGFGMLYLTTAGNGSAAAAPGLAITAAAFAVTALLATLAAHVATMTGLIRRSQNSP